MGKEFGSRLTHSGLNSFRTHWWRQSILMSIRIFDLVMVGLGGLKKKIKYTRAGVPVISARGRQKQNQIKLWHVMGDEGYHEVSSELCASVEKKANTSLER